MERIIRNKGIIASVLVTTLFFWTAGISAEKGIEKKDITRKTITGEIGGIGPNFIAVVYAKDDAKGIDYEMALPLKESAQFVNIKNLKDLKVGDSVTIQYEEEATTGMEKVRDEKGKEKEEIKKKVKRFAAIIKFDKRLQESSVYVE